MEVTGTAGYYTILGVGDVGDDLLLKPTQKQPVRTPAGTRAGRTGTAGRTPSSAGRTSAGRGTLSIRRPTGATAAQKQRERPSLLEQKQKGDSSDPTNSPPPLANEGIPLALRRSGVNEGLAADRFRIYMRRIGKRKPDNDDIKDKLKIKKWQVKQYGSEMMKRMQEFDEVAPVQLRLKEFDGQGDKKSKFLHLLKLHPFLIGTDGEFEKGKEFLGKGPQIQEWQIQRNNKHQEQLRKRKDEHHIKVHGIEHEERANIKKLKKKQYAAIAQQRRARQEVCEECRDGEEEVCEECRKYPFVSVPKDQIKLGDFKKLDLEPGDFGFLKAVDGADELLKEFVGENKAGEIGMPEHFGKRTSNMLLTHDFGVPLARFVGKHRDPTIKAKTNENFNGWTVQKEAIVDSDLTFVYPTTEATLRKCLEELRDAGLATLLPGVAEFLEIPTTKEGFTLIFSELSFIAVSFKKNDTVNDTIHSDFGTQPNMASFIVPLLLPSCMKPEFVFKVGKESEYPKDSIYPRTVRKPIVKGYRYQLDRALIFKGGVDHNTNGFGHVSDGRGYRLMLQLHIGQYEEASSECLWNETKMKSFRGPAFAEFVRGRKLSTEIAEEWKLKYGMTVKKNANEEPSLTFGWETKEWKAWKAKYGHDN